MSPVRDQRRAGRRPRPRARRAARRCRTPCRSSGRRRSAPCRARPAASSLLRQRQVGHLRHARGSPCGPQPRSTSTESASTSRSGSSMRACRSSMRVEDHGPAAVLQQVRRGRGRLDDGAVGREVAAQHGDARRRPAAASARGRMTSRSQIWRVVEVVDERPAGDGDRASGRAGPRTSRSTASSPPARWRSSIRNRPAGCRSTSSGTPAPMRSKSSRVSVDAEPAGDGQQVHDGVGRAADRGQRDDRVEERAAGQDRRSGGGPAATSSTASRPVVVGAPRAAGCRAPGVPAMPGSVMPERLGDARPSSRPCPSCCSGRGCGSSTTPSAGTRSSRQRARRAPPRDSRHTSVPQPSGTPRNVPVSIGPPGTTTAGRSTDAAAISSAGIVLSQPPSSTTPSIGLARSISSVAIAAMLRQSIAVGRTCVSPSDTTGRFSGMPPASQTPCLTLSATSSRWALHGRQVGGGVGDRDVRPAVERVRRQPAAHPGPVDVGVAVRRRRTTATALARPRTTAFFRSSPAEVYTRPCGSVASRPTRTVPVALGRR